MKLRPEEVAPVLLRLALPRIQGAGFIPESVAQVSVVEAAANRDYPFCKKQAVSAFLNSAWSWIERNGLSEPAEGMNGRNGWRHLTEAGEAVANGQDLARLRMAANNRDGVLNQPFGLQGTHDGRQRVIPGARAVSARTSISSVSSQEQNASSILCRSRSRYACSCRSPGCAAPGSPPRNTCGLASVSIPASPNRSSARWCAPPSACGTTELPQGA
jgi:hypothetical protein